MVPLDGSELAECVFPHLESFIQRFSLDQIILARVVQPPKKPSPIQASQLESIEKNIVERESLSRDYLETVSKKIPADGVDMRLDVIVGTVAESLIDHAREKAVDLILMATHGRSGISRWVMGSVADRILHGAIIPILMIRSPGVKELRLSG